jgi:beta-lactamase superfamily II metal-dependent hydrolase
VSIFTLEALQAEQGDCFLLHAGSTRKPQLLLVDGGPSGDTYPDVLEPRLRTLGQHFGARLELPLVVCSHIDDDHIGGVLALVQATQHPRAPATIDCLWHNRPLDLVGEKSAEHLAAVLRELDDAERFATKEMRARQADGKEADFNFAAIVSSVQQGDDLYAAAKSAHIHINCGFDGLVMAPTPNQGFSEHAIGDLNLLVIGPDKEQIDELRKKWTKETKDHTVSELLARSAEIAAEVAADDDPSVTNLSSIVFLAEYNNRSILMTGDARGDYVIQGLNRAGRVNNGKARVDVLKLQHHGSSHNADEEFFATVIANDYVISADGTDGNPDPPIFDALVAARGQTGYRIWLTNGDHGTPLAATVRSIRAKYQRLDLRVRPALENSLRVNVDEPLDY